MRFRTSLLGLLAIVAACSSPAYVAQAPVDPCDAAYYNEPACQQAVSSNGFYFQGAFVPHVYVQPFTYYHSYYGTYRARGGVVHVVSPSYYSRSYVSPARPSIYSSPSRSMTPRTTVVSPYRSSSSYSPPRSMTPRTTVYSSPSRSYSRPSSSSSYSRRSRR
jgi:hypothetical protein